ncbi:MAG: aspartate/glutamate racemase family protein [Alphaproteobacteria bacterium]
MTIYKTRKSAESYGQAVGILLLDAKAPFIPGDVANAHTYDYPVIYKTVEGLSTSVCLNGAPEFNAKMAAAAKELEEAGVRGISSDCGFMLQFQAAVREAVKVPVALSSLLQLPFIAKTVESSRPIGVITADSTNLTMDFLARAGVKVKNPLIIRGLQNEPEFKTAVLEEKGTLDSDLITEETIRCAKDMVKQHPTMGAILLECSMLPPYARAVQEAVNLPVYDFISMIDYMQSGTQQHAYQGVY